MVVIAIIKQQMDKLCWLHKRSKTKDLSKQDSLLASHYPANRLARKTQNQIRRLLQHLFAPFADYVSPASMKTKKATQAEQCR